MAKINIDEKLQCVVLKYGSDKEFLVDYADLNVIQSNAKAFHFIDETAKYPSYLMNYNRINLLEHLYDVRDNFICHFINGNESDLRRANVKVFHKKHAYVAANYKVVEYFAGHYKTMGPDAYFMKNPRWLVEDDTTGALKMLIYCEPDHFVQICPAGYEKIANFHEQPLTFRIHGNGLVISSFRNFYMNQIISGCQKNNVTIEHLDNDPLNNCLDNIRVVLKVKPTKVKEFKIKPVKIKELKIKPVKIKEAKVETRMKKTKVEEAPILAVASPLAVAVAPPLVAPPLVAPPLGLADAPLGLADAQKIFIETNYGEIVEYFPGHLTTIGRIMNNPRWTVRDSGGNTKMFMYCETDTYVQICPASYQKILDFQLAHNDLKNVTFYKHTNGYIGCHFQNLYMHQIITGCYGNGKGTKNISVDHIDQNPLNNTWANLRIATREEQEQNSNGIKEGTKRKRQCIARDLPEGLTQDMMRKYVVYYHECYNKEKALFRDFFKVEGHPKLPDGKIWISSKSNKISWQEKLANANKVVDDLAEGVFPVAPENKLPPYYRVEVKSGKTQLVYDHKTETVRHNMRMVIPDNYNLEEELVTFNIKLEEKYQTE